MARRLVRHHLPLAAAVLASSTALYVTRPYPDILSRLSFATAYPALVLLGATLLIGPVRLLTGRQNAVSLDLRRDFGIWAGIVGMFHSVVGQCVHLRGRPWLYYVYEKWSEHALPLRHDVFGFANYTGAAAALILAVLLVTSNDAALRRLGTPEWKSLQRWNYACFGFTALHCFLYQLGVENQQAAFVAAAAICVMLTAVVQLAGYRLRKRQMR